MKKILFFATAMLCSLCALTACSDDNDSNPVLIQPDGFVLNTPSLAAYTIDLKNSKIDLTWSQPKYTAENAPVNALYQIFVSSTDSYTTSLSEATDEAPADYAVMGETTQKCNITLSGASIMKALMQLNGWTEDAMPETVDVYIRVDASVAGRNHVQSNSVKLNFEPYYLELKTADPQFWFLVGNGAVGNWNNGADDMGNSTIPLCLKDGAVYNEQTGEGEFTYTGYFNADQFKLVLNPGKWAPMWGASDEGLNGNPIYRPTEADTDPACWKPAEAGYYTINFNSTAGTAGTKIKVTKYEGATPKKFKTMEFVGDFNNWANEGAEPVHMTANSVNPHVWYCDVTIPADGGAKFRTDKDWKDNWGGDAFPYGLTGGNNIPVKAGKYRVVFNDIDKCYHFFTVE